MRRTAVTLIELLIVITVIAVLMGLLLTGLSLLKRMRGKATTERLLSNLVFAMTNYIDANPTFVASVATDFNATPSRVWKYLGRDGNRYVELKTADLGDATGSPVSNPQSAETIIDGFGLPVVIRIVQGPTINGRQIPARIEVSSRNGTNSAAYPDSDDIIWRYDADGVSGLSAEEQRNVGKFWRKQ